MTVYADPPAVPGLAQLASAGGAANPYDVNTHWRSAIMALKDLLDGTEEHGADYLLRPGPASNYRIRLGDAAGARKISVEDSLLAEIFAVDSNGNLTLAGTVDGIDVAAHAGGTAMAQHTGGLGTHTHQSAGAEGGQLDHGLALTGLGDDDHTQYVLRSILTTRGDIFIRGAAVIQRLGLVVPGANVRNVLGVDNAETDPSWKTALDATNPANIAAAAAPGTSLLFSHRDHVHAHPDLGDLHTGYLLATGARAGATAGAQAFTLGIQLGADVVITRGAADRLDLAAGDTLRTQADASNYAELRELIQVYRGAVGSSVIGARVAGDAVARLVVSAGGLLQWGDGTAALDTRLSRGAADRLDLGSGDALVIPGAAGDFAAPVNGMLWYNTTTGKLRAYESGAWQNVV